MSVATEHTPGPWEVGEDGKGRVRVFAGRDEIVRAMSRHGDRRLSQAERTANRNLIAASPDLLQAAKLALNFIANTESEQGITLDSGDALRDAIAKAEQSA